MSQEKLIIIGSGPAGYTAAIYAARAELKPLLFAGIKSGGQLMLTTDVENFPGFVTGIQGPELMATLRRQAERFGARVLDQFVSEVDFSRSPFLVQADGQTYEASSLILATGADALWLNVPGEQTYQGHGVSACATCDGFFFKGKEIAVAGGGDAAMEEANFLTRFAAKVTVIHRRAELRASKIMQERAQANPKIDFVWNTEIQEVLGDGQKMTGLRLLNNQTNEVSELHKEGLFVAIGHKPNSQLFEGKLELDRKGYVVCQPGSTATNVPGVFAAGDLVDHRYRQAITAAGSGCAAALDAEKWLEARTESPKA